MAEGAITFLPAEIIEYILEDKHIGFVDVVNFGLTCKHLHKIVSDSNQLWYLKFFQRWPFLKETYTETRRLDSVLSWKYEAKASLTVRQETLYLLSQMSYKNYEKQDLSTSDFQDFDSLICPKAGAHPLAYYYVLDELMTLINGTGMDGNLTHKYYACKVIRHLKHNHLKKEWEKFINLPPRKQVLEYGATLISQWSQPTKHVPYSYVSGLLDNIAEEAKDLLKEQCSGHPIFSVPKEQLSYWKHNNIDDNQWSVAETRQAMDAVCKALFQKLECHGSNEMHYLPENYFIDCVLKNKRGIPITSAIIFESIARRLGIRCEPVSFPSHFLLRWKESYTSTETQQLENFYIDVFDGGRLLTKNSCPRIGGVRRCPIEKYNVHESATAVEVAMRIANNLAVAARQLNDLDGKLPSLRSAVELQHMIEPYNKDILIQLGRYYLTNKIYAPDLTEKFENISREGRSRGQAEYLPEIITRLQSLSQLEFQTSRQGKKRRSYLKYAIGLIMKDKTYGYTCVITGWDLEEWDRSGQPFYHVLVDNGSSLYVAQKYLFLAPNPHWINHYEIGRYFQKFCGTHYLPNEESAREYSQDEEIRNELLGTYQNSMQVDSS